MLLEALSGIEQVINNLQRQRSNDLEDPRHLNAEPGNDQRSLEILDELRFLAFRQSPPRTRPGNLPFEQLKCQNSSKNSSTE